MHLRGDSPSASECCIESKGRVVNQMALHGSHGLILFVCDPRHAVIAVAEGAGQDIMAQPENVELDPSGNPKKLDVGRFLRDKIVAHFKSKDIPLTLKYIDPSYIIRSVPAGTRDKLLSDGFARCAVHAAM